MQMPFDVTLCTSLQNSFVVSSKLKSKIRFQKLEKNLGPHKLSKSYKAKTIPMSNTKQCILFVSRTEFALMFEGWD